MFQRIRRRAGCGVLVLAAIVTAQQKKPLTNQDIVAMVKNGFSESLIVLAIRANPCEFDTSADGLIALKTQNVSDAVIREMLATASTKRKHSSAPSPTASASSNLSPPSNPTLTSAPASNLAPQTRLNSTPPFPTFPVDFSAEQVVIQGTMPVATEGSIYVSRGRLRFAPASAGAITIVDPAQLTAYIVSPGKAAEVTHRFEGVRGVVTQNGLSKFLLPADPDNPCAFWLDVECKALGTESIDGRSATKWEITHTPGAQTWVSYLWVDVTLHIVSKTLYQDYVTQLQKIVEGVQSVVFEVP